MQDLAKGLDHFGWQDKARWGIALDGGQSCTGGQALAGLPLVEGVAVVGQQGEQLGLGVVEVKDHGRTETAQQGGHRFLGNALKNPLLL